MGLYYEAETTELFYRHGKTHHFDTPRAIHRAMAEKLHGSIFIE